MGVACPLAQSIRKLGLKKKTNTRARRIVFQFRVTYLQEWEERLPCLCLENASQQLTSLLGRLAKVKLVACDSRINPYALMAIMSLNTIDIQPVPLC